MEDLFEIPVTYKGVEYSFPAELLMSGYTQKIQVDVLGEIISFEMDEERNFRPILTNEQLDRRIKVDIDLLKAIVEVIESVRER